MELSGKWWRSDVALEVHATLTDRERARKRVFQGRSPQLTFRRQLVDWITSIAERHKLSLTSLHLAVYLLDFFMDNFDVSRNQLNLVAMGCLSVATKFEEKEEDIPKQNVLSHYCGGAYAASDFLQMELMLLKFFDWEVGLVSPAHFINFYVHFTCSEIDLAEPSTTEADQMEQQKKIYESVKSYARYFMSVCIQYHHFHDYLPSVTAAASICATRVCLNLLPVFPLQLQNIHPFSESQLLACQRDLLLIHDRDKNRGPAEAETKRPKPETSTPEGTPEGVHVSTNHRGGEEKDDSVYHSDLSLDSDPESLPMDVATTTIATATTTAAPARPPASSSSFTSRVCSPSCSPIAKASNDDKQPQQQQHQQQHQQHRLPQQQQPHFCLNSLGSSTTEEELEADEKMAEEGEGEEEEEEEEEEELLLSSGSHEQCSTDPPSDEGVAETIEIDMENGNGDDDMLTAVGGASFDGGGGGVVVKASPAFVDLVNDSNDDDEEDDDDDDDVVVISEEKRKVMKVRDDSGVGFVADDLGAEEEFYDVDEVFIEELQPTVHPSIRCTSVAPGCSCLALECNCTSVDDFVYVEKLSEVQIFLGDPATTTTTTTTMTETATTTTMVSAAGGATASESYVSDVGTFHVVTEPFCRS